MNQSMTNPTPTENERIALLRGWTKDYTGTWYNPEGINFGTTYHPPDYLHEWEHAGPLLEELIGAGFEVELLQCFKERRCSTYRRPYLDREEGPYGAGDTLEAAISRAWLAWKEEK